MKQKIFTNCFLVKTDDGGKPSEVCLAIKKRGFGQGLWNGSGGKPNENESIEEAACREVQEEFKVTVINIDKRGEITFYLRQEEKIVLMHTFLVTKWGHEPVETEEMKPKWFSVNEVPYDQMWGSDKEWLPIILSGKKIKAKYTYAQEGGAVETRELEEVDNF
jgi:8-oxo-dGTP diphosphatase/2-hydroxy-dATP diphosphatase